MNLKQFSAISGLAIALAACNPVDDGTTDPEVTADVEGDNAVVEDDAYPVGGELSTEQQASYDAMDREGVSREYDMNRDTMMQESMERSASGNTGGSDNMSGSASSSDGSASNSGNMASDDAGDSMSGNSSSGNVINLPPRGQMDFAFLDRNSDGKLSVAEYAIWAVPANPTTPAPNDETKPYLTTQQINEAGNTFFYFDEDGSTYLSESEFTDARNSARSP
ncbi:hypothetical protein [Qipengyuania sp. JC766]|uniref:hypothetical protein n=1 Tax=Qipengyuania sp. JC766 TaxID=3232139 RepID=UPI00345ABE6F